jgi:putative redox protein
MASERIAIAGVNARHERRCVEIQAGRLRHLAIEPASLRHGEEGPALYELLLNSLAECTAIALHMYAERKGWPLQGLSVALEFSRLEPEAGVDRTIVVEGLLAEDQRALLAEVAERTPVTLTLKSGVNIRTELRR